MRFRSFRLTLPALAAAAVLAACGGDATGPVGQLDAVGTRQTVQTIDQSFSAASVRSFTDAAASIDAAIGGAGFAQALVVPPATEEGGRLRRYAAERMAQVERARARGAEVAANIPTLLLGRTFEWSATQNRYVIAQTPPTDIPAVPGNGVRFLLYQWDTVTNRPATPLTRVGYADLTETTNAQGRSFRFVITANNTVFLDYSVAYSFTQATSTIAYAVTGFVTNGTTRADFTLNNSLGAANNGSLTLDYEVRVPSRNIVLDYLISLRNLNPTPRGDEQLVVDLLLQGDGGRIDVEGTLTVAAGNTVNTEDDDLFEGFSGALEVDVNGGLFATITFNGSEDPTFTNGQGQPLTDDQEDALEDVFDLIEDGFDFIEDLLDPIERLFDN